VAALVLLALVALLVIRWGGGSPATDLGDQSEPSSLRAALDSAINAAIAKGKHEAASNEASTTCAAEVRGSYGQGLGSLVYAAGLRWQGVPAVALAYKVDDAGATGLDHRVFIVSRVGCQLLVVQSL